jgi:hypothetical protein
MKHKSKVALAALFIAAAVAPVAAQAKTYNGAHRAAYLMSYETRAQRLIEGRNAAAFGGFGTFNSAPSGRDALVQSLGN